MKYITLKTDIIKVSPQIPDYMTTELIYVPLNNPENLQFFVKKNEYVYKQDKLAPNIYSPVSGFVKEIKEATLENKQKIRCLVIQNDGKEQFRGPTYFKKNIHNYSLVEVKSILKEFNQDNISRRLTKNIIVKGFTDEVNSATEIMLLYRKTELILETMDALCHILNLKNIYLVIKDNDEASVKKVMSMVGRYPQIKVKLIPNYYGLYDNENLQNYLQIKEKVNFFDLNEIITIYNLLKKRQLTTKRYLTITGNKVTKARVVNVKIGTQIKDVLKKFKEEISDNNLYISNGLMQGEEVDIDTLIMTDNLKSLYIQKKATENQPLECLNCSLCTSVCLKGLNPRQMIDENKCNHCNLCSYICPSYIKLPKKEGK